MEDGSIDEELSDYDDIRPASKKGKKASDKSNKGKGKANGESSKSQQAQQDDPMAASQRKIQNRVAQREFRQRKLQYVKDLEARVEFLSGSRDSQLEALKAMLRGVLEENKQLRTLLQQVSAFVGKGLGGHSHELGFQNVEDFEEFVNRHDRDTLHRIHEGWKTKYAKNNKVETSASPSAGKDNQGHNSTEYMQETSHQTKAASTRNGEATAGLPSPADSASSVIASGNIGGLQNDTTATNSRKRARETDSHTAPARSELTGNPPTAYAQTANATGSTSAMPAVSSFALPTTTDLFNNSTFNSNFGNMSSSSFFFDFGDPSASIPSSSYADLFSLDSNTAPYSAASVLNPATWDTPPAATFPTSLAASPAHETLTNGQKSTNTVLGTSSSAITAGLGSSIRNPAREVGEPNPLIHAIQVITTHLRNKAANPLYELPEALQFTPLQLSTPHNTRINSLPWAGMRDRMIQNPQYDLNEVMTELAQSAELHSTEEIFNPEYWEMSEQFCQRYRALIPPELLRASNYWRQLRGEPEIQL